MKNISVLGSTGSVGTQTLEVIDYLDDKWNVLSLSAYSNIDLLEKQIKKYNPKYAVVIDNKSAKILNNKLKNSSTEVLQGKENLEKIASLSNLDLVINSIVGAAGLKPSIAALEVGHTLGLANKESLVIGGHLIAEILNNQNGKILPVDSEHNAIFHLLEDKVSKEIENILLTASGGPFFNKNKEGMNNVTVEDALDHPNWDMGNKITIDSATMMNKGLEVIEAHWLFDVDYDKIKVVVHPESIIHSMVEFCDKTITAELGVPDMKTPIQSVLTYPNKIKGEVESLDLFEIGQLNFKKPDFNKFPNLKLAYEAGKKGGSMPIVLNAANEVAVNLFLNKKISFLEISEIIEKTLGKHQKINFPNIDDIMEIDKWARKNAKEECK
ncbi:MAG TPA: 1-deoxy-D-xylulose-5-phosphate reductoisomerase [Halanaerobiales bacterium]|nr:1-deoxy-D-xylulose-5-phosphate reductoisomerase [Halanaerobiales bacterium]